MVNPGTGMQQTVPSGLARIGFSPAPFIHAVAFVAGFSLVFTGLGALLGSLGTGSWRGLAGDRGGNVADYPGIPPERDCAVRPANQYSVPAKRNRDRSG